MLNAKLIICKTTIFQRSKYYDSPTRATRLKVASNMADLIGIRHCRYTLKTRDNLKDLEEDPNTIANSVLKFKFSNINIFQSNMYQNYILYIRLTFHSAFLRVRA